MAMSPVSGVIVRWHLLKAAGGPFRLRVLRPAGGSSYTAVGTSVAATAATPGLETFTTELPIQAGDTIGLDIIKGLKAGDPEPRLHLRRDLADPGRRLYPTSHRIGSGRQMAFNAEVQPTPTVTSIGPGSGLFKGGTPVRISGTDFTGVSGQLRRRAGEEPHRRLRNPGQRSRPGVKSWQGRRHRLHHRRHQRGHRRRPLHLQGLRRADAEGEDAEGSQEEAT